MTSGRDRSDSPEDLIHPHGRGASFWFQQMDTPRPQRNRVHVDVWAPYDQAEARIAAAIAAGGHLVTDEYAPSHWVLADAEGNEACIGTAGWTDLSPERYSSEQCCSMRSGWLAMNGSTSSR